MGNSTKRKILSTSRKKIIENFADLKKCFKFAYRNKGQTQTDMADTMNQK